MSGVGCDRTGFDERKLINLTRIVVRAFGQRKMKAEREGERESAKATIWTGHECKRKMK